MAIIHTTPKQSGTEGLLKLLDTITDEIVLSHGKILMGQFCNALKLSLFVEKEVYDYIGVRNVFIEDVRDTVVIRFGNKEQTEEALETLRATENWQQAFPSRYGTYRLTELDQAACAVRDYLLLGKPIGSPTPPNLFNRAMPKVSMEVGYVQFNVLDTLPDHNGYN